MRTCCTARWRKWRCEIISQQGTAGIWLVKRPGCGLRNSEFYMVLGDAWQSSGKPQEAVAAYEQALRLRPDFPRGLVELASALKGAGQLPRAEETLKRALAIAPSNPAAWLQYGDGRLRAWGESRRPIAKMEKAIALDPELPGEHAGLGGDSAREPARRIAPPRRCKRRCGSIPTMAPHTILRGRALAGERRVGRNRFTISKRPHDSAPATRRIFTTMDWRSSA